MKSKTLLTCNTLHEAYLIKGRLENEGIRVYINNEYFSTLMPLYNNLLGAGIQLIVDENDLQCAADLLKDKETIENLCCPHCGSTNINFGFGEKRYRKLFTIILSLLIWIPFNNIKKKYYCRDCQRSI